MIIEVELTIIVPSFVWCHMLLIFSRKFIIEVLKME